MDKIPIIFFSFFLIVITLLLHKSLPKVMASESDLESGIEIIPPSVTINDVDVKQDTITIETSEGDIELILDRRIPSGFKHKIRDNFFEFGYNYILPEPINVSVMIESDFPLSNYGCEQDGDDWDCDYQFTYESFNLNLGDLEDKNPDIITNITKINNYTYELELNGLQNFDPVAVDGSEITITGSYTCQTLDAEPDVNGIFDCKGTTPEVCELDGTIVIANNGVFNVSNCIISNEIGDKTGGSAIITVESGGYLEFSLAGGFNSTRTTYENTIQYEGGSSGVVNGAYLDELGTGTGFNRHGLWLEDEINVINSTFGEGKWLITLNRPTFLNSEANNINIINNSLGYGTNTVVKNIVIYASDSNNIIGNGIYRFSNTGIESQSATAGGEPVYSDNNLIQGNTVDGGDGTNAVVGISILDYGNNNIINDNAITHIHRNSAGKSSTGIIATGSYTNMTDNSCSAIGGDQANEESSCIYSYGDYNYINGTNSNNLGQATCAKATSIIIFGNHTTSENSFNLQIAGTGDCGVVYEVSGNYNTINENYLELVNNDDNTVYGIELTGDNNTINAVKITRTAGTFNGFEAMHIEGDNNIIMNSYVNVDGDYAADGINFESARGNEIIDSELQCSANCGTDNEDCDTENVAYAISGDYYFADFTNGTFRNTLLNTTYTEWCAGDDTPIADIYELEVQWYLDVYVQDNIGFRMQDVDLNLSNSSNFKLADTVTDVNGERSFNVTQYIQNHTDGTWDETPLYLNASREDTGVNNSRIPFTTNTLWGITLFTSVQDTYNYFYFFMILIAFILIIVGRKTQEYIFSFCSGIIFVVTSLMLIQEGHPALVNEYLSNTVPFILLAIGIFFMVEGIIKIVEEHF